MLRAWLTKGSSFSSNIRFSASEPACPSWIILIRQLGQARLQERSCARFTRFGGSATSVGRTTAGADGRRGGSRRAAINGQCQRLQWLKSPSITELRISCAAAEFQIASSGSVRLPIGTGCQAEQQKWTAPVVRVSICSNGAGQNRVLSQRSTSSSSPVERARAASTIRCARRSWWSRAVTSPASASAASHRRARSARSAAASSATIPSSALRATALSASAAASSGAAACTSASMNPSGETSGPSAMVRARR